MRLWTLHPKMLDQKGLVGLWREGLLAQNVLLGKTKGYKNHPQLIRFRQHPYPVNAICYYLIQIYKEATTRGYAFDFKKIRISTPVLFEQIQVNSGQINYEREHLLKKLKIRNFEVFQRVMKIPNETNSTFCVVSNPSIESWEIV